MSKQKRSVVIAASDQLFGEAVSTYLAGQDGWEVVGTALDGLHALSVITRLQPSCALVIGDLPRLGTAALANRVRHRSPETMVVVLGQVEAPDERVLDANVGAADVLLALAERPGFVAETSTDGKRSDIDKLRGLTPRERITLRLLAEGRSRDDVARQLNVSTHTVRTHMQNLYTKLGVHSRLELVHFASRHGLLGGGE